MGGLGINCANMEQPAYPADNPVYFSMLRLSGEDKDVVDSLATIDKLAEKHIKQKPRKRLSLKGLFKGGKSEVTERRSEVFSPEEETQTLGRRGLAKLRSLDLVAPGKSLLGRDHG